MIVNSFQVVTVGLVLVIGIELCGACENGQMKQGCLIRNLVCSCGFGCVSDYRYNNMQDCQAALRGKKKDICKVQIPCLHGGTCIQVSQDPGYKCRCEGSGYYGARCHRPCPISGAGRIGDRNFPYECIEI
ncbi:protein crumbs homolog 1-like [Anthonomus grandis grandis]|uniref:protein crumbs homolog 1-like n=1 Tax=Anthonomus grandis grandis TaxID=2921223 RepID=UPI002165EF30|nr:protein crumbs homolog 1-like [Anthonomus grandis grandis]